LEHVIANLTVSYPVRGDIKLTLVSPSGTPSEILSFRSNDKTVKGIKKFPFMTLHNWGESPIGIWRLIIETRDNNQIDNKGLLIDYSLIFYGTINDENSKTKRSLNQKRAFRPDNDEIIKMYRKELKKSKKLNIKNKRVL
jgi:subtilisin-like proprotein convertase family protein